MKRIAYWLVTSAILASLVGCGLKGPLYFPPPAKPQQQDRQSADRQNSTTSSQPQGQRVSPGVQVNP